MQERERKRDREGRHRAERRERERLSTRCWSRSRIKSKPRNEVSIAPWKPFHTNRH